MVYYRVTGTQRGHRKLFGGRFRTKINAKRAIKRTPKSRGIKNPRILKESGRTFKWALKHGTKLRKWHGYY